MMRTTLPGTGIDVSRICLGTMTWGNQNSQSEGFEQMDYALSKGINFWDTAELYAVPTSPDTYGKTETIIGNWFKETGRRDEVVLASKVVGQGIPWIRDGEPINPKGMRSALEGSLARLQTEYIDLYQLHWPNRGHYHFRKIWDYDPSHLNKAEVEDNILAILETLGTFVQEGKVRHIGLSNETAWGVSAFTRLAEVHNLPRVATIQNEYNLLYRQFESDLSETCALENVGLLAYSPLAFGLLTGKYNGGVQPKGARMEQAPDLHGRVNAHSLAATEKYVAVAKKHGLDPATMAIAFTLTRQFLTSTIIGATSMEQLKACIAGGETTLSDACMADIMEVYRTYPMPM